MTAVLKPHVYLLVLLIIMSVGNVEDEVGNGTR
jgi:hypothetical protein